MRVEKIYYVYMLASKRNGTLGVTNDIIRRVSEHKEGIGSVFTKSYGVKLLVYYESFSYVEDAIYREKILKQWKRQ
jgi:putative endonuclease